MAMATTMTGGTMSHGGLSIGTGGPAAMSGKMQLSRSASQGGLFSNNGRFGLSGGLGSKGAGGNRSMSSSVRAKAEVRALGGDEPTDGDSDAVPRSAHDQLMMRLKSRAVRLEAENNRSFLAQYRLRGSTHAASEAKLDSLLKQTAQRAEELRVRSEETQAEAAEAERKLERVNAVTVGRASESELQAMNAFEKLQRSIVEDKKDEELQRLRDEAQASYAKVHRRLQNELIELRDYKVLLREYRRVRLEKLQELFACTEDGRKLRACVREMIRHGAQRILQRLESANLPFEPWMREVLVNGCHLEIRIEDAEAKLLQLRREALKPVKADIEAMICQSKQERFQKLCSKTWDTMKSLRDEANAQRQMELDNEHWAGGGDVFPPPAEPVVSTPPAKRTVVVAPNEDARAGVTVADTKAIPADITAEMTAVETEIAALRRLLADMRQNAAAVICNQIRQQEKAGGRQAGREAVEWGRAMLTLLVSEDFAKVTMKELQKSAPHAKLTH